MRAVLVKLSASQLLPDTCRSTDQIINCCICPFCPAVTGDANVLSAELAPGLGETLAAGVCMAD